MKFIFSKKAGLQMSINAIVVLVMAMVVLGLGLGFIRGMFNSAENKFIGAIDNVDLTNPPTPEKPITFEKATLKVKKSKAEEFTYSVYNNQGVDYTNVNLYRIGCTDGLGFNVKSVGAPIEDGAYVTFKGLLEAPADVLAGEYVCSLGARDGTAENTPSFASTQLTIKVSA